MVHFVCSWSECGVRADPQPGPGNPPTPDPPHLRTRMGVLRPVLPPRAEECGSSPTGPPGAPQGTWEEGRRGEDRLRQYPDSPSCHRPWGESPAEAVSPAGPPALPLLLRLLGPRRRLLPTQPQAGLPRSPSAPLPSHRLGGWGSAIGWPINCRRSRSGELGGTGEHLVGPSPASPATLPLRQEALSSSIRCGNLQAQFKSSACVPRAPTPPAAVCVC